MGKFATGWKDLTKNKNVKKQTKKAYKSNKNQKNIGKNSTSLKICTVFTDLNKICIIHWDEFVQIDWICIDFYEKMGFNKKCQHRICAP